MGWWSSSPVVVFASGYSARVAVGRGGMLTNEMTSLVVLGQYLITAVGPSGVPVAQYTGTL